VRTTTPYMTKYERARIIGARALQISMNAPVMVSVLFLSCWRDVGHYPSFWADAIVDFGFGALVAHHTPHRARHCTQCWLSSMTHRASWPCMRNADANALPDLTSEKERG